MPLPLPLPLPLAASAVAPACAWPFAVFRLFSSLSSFSLSASSLLFPACASSTSGLMRMNSFCRFPTFVNRSSHVFTLAASSFTVFSTAVSRLPLLSSFFSSAFSRASTFSSFWCRCLISPVSFSSTFSSFLYRWVFSLTSFSASRWNFPASSFLSLLCVPPLHFVKNLPLSFSSSFPVMMSPFSGTALPATRVMWKKIGFSVIFFFFCTSFSLYAKPNPRFGS
mmetsp:Transcript_25646/g.64643  ORF Transcript_25646/g.64643 Transcript_25646/m.64643 type:complete len:224 (-) Transcript_25646:250-921(-)